MKKWFLYLALTLIALVLFSGTTSAFINVRVPEQGTLGETIEIIVDAIHAPNASHISVFITKANTSMSTDASTICDEANKTSGSKIHLKKIIQSPIGGSVDWETGSEQTVLGQHQIIAVQMVSTPDVPCNPSNVIDTASAQINITSSSEPGNGENGTAPDITFPNIVISPPKGGVDEDKTRPELNEDNFTEILMKELIERFLQIGAGLALIALVYSGIMYITSSGDPQKAESAKKNLIWAIVGIIIMLLGLLIVQTIPDILS